MSPKDGGRHNNNNTSLDCFEIMVGHVHKFSTIHTCVSSAVVRISDLYQADQGQGEQGVGLLSFQYPSRHQQTSWT